MVYFSFDTSDLIYPVVFMILIPLQQCCLTFPFYYYGIIYYTIVYCDSTRDLVCNVH